jgi:hypothetical protein
MTLLYTLVEDEAHKKFLSQCGNIVSELNSECTTRLAFESKPLICNGIHELVVNTLPGFLGQGGTTRYLLVLDLNTHTEGGLFEWVVKRIDGAKTKGSAGQYSYTIKVENRRDNIILVKINNYQKKIVILPMGLNEKKLPNIRHHSVEDYCLAQIPENDYRGDNSKLIIEELLCDKILSEEEVRANIKKSISDYGADLSKYLRPLWEPITCC